MNKINFTNLPSTTTPVNATNLNLLQDNVDNGKLEKKVSSFTGDYNNLTDIGFYYVDGSSTNGPATGFSHYVTVYKLSDNFICQVAYRVTATAYTQYIFIRQRYSGTWTSWARAGEPVREGTFTPSLKGSVNAGTATYDLREGSYKKIGGTVFINFRIACSKMQNSSGYFVISDLPFTVDTDPSIVNLSAQGGGIFETNAIYQARRLGTQNLVIGRNLNAMSNSNWTSPTVYIYGTGFYFTNE